MARLQGTRNPFIDYPEVLGGGNIPPAEAEAHYYVQINELAMVA